MTFEDTDELRTFLRTIKTYDQFWDAKEPEFGDVQWKQVMDLLIADGASPDDILIGLKGAVVTSYTEEREARKPENLN